MILSICYAINLNKSHLKCHSVAPVAIDVLAWQRHAETDVRVACVCIHRIAVAPTTKNIRLKWPTDKYNEAIHRLWCTHAKKNV